MPTPSSAPPRSYTPIMVRERYNLDGKDPLPPGDGPSLAPFEHRKEPVEFLELLSLPEAEDSSKGGHGHVFKVRIKGSVYALKVVRRAATEIKTSSKWIL